MPAIGRGTEPSRWRRPGPVTLSSTADSGVSHGVKSKAPSDRNMAPTCSAASWPRGRRAARRAAPPPSPASRSFPRSSPASQAARPGSSAIGQLAEPAGLGISVVLPARWMLTRSLARDPGPPVGQWRYAGGQRIGDMSVRPAPVRTSTRLTPVPRTCLMTPTVTESIQDTRSPPSGNLRVDSLPPLNGRIENRRSLPPAAVGSFRASSSRAPSGESRRRAGSKPGPPLGSANLPLTRRSDRAPRG